MFEITPQRKDVSITAPPSGFLKNVIALSPHTSTGIWRFSEFQLRVPGVKSAREVSENLT